MNIFCCGCGVDVVAELVSGKEIYPHRADLYALPAKPEHAAEIERLKALLRDAASDLAEWGSYVPEYFVEKHKLDDDIQKYLQAGEKTK